VPKHRYAAGLASSEPAISFVLTQGARMVCRTCLRVKRSINSFYQFGNREKRPLHGGLGGRFFQLRLDKRQVFEFAHGKQARCIADFCSASLNS